MTKTYDPAITKKGFYRDLLHVGSIRTLLSFDGDTIRLSGVHTADDPLGNANVAALEQEYKAILKFKRLYGGTTVWLDFSRLPKKSVYYLRLINTLNALTNYPVIDDDLYSRLDQEERRRSWLDHLADEVRKIVIKHLETANNIEIYDHDLFFDWLTGEDTDVCLDWLYPYAVIERDGGGSFLSGDQTDLLSSAMKRFHERIASDKNRDWLMIVD